ncbi:hypothetical protein DXV76_19605 [Rhodobacteraceae bacterium CCMM004]|nr:hypothetical protein DXV76_19605 [Rhodobacteraceae bacterium CCMM004]
MIETTNTFSPAVRSVLETEPRHPSRWQAVMSIAAKIGCTAQTPNEGVEKAEVDSGRRLGIPTEMAEETKTLERENRELRHANEILRKASASFAMAEFIEGHRGAHGVAPICAVLPIAPSTSYDHLAKRSNPARLSDRARCDEALRPEIRRVFGENWRIYGIPKVWHQVRR